MCLCCVRCVCFFFKQKTAYELRISDWSSDVCSSDLVAAPGEGDFDGGGWSYDGDLLPAAGPVVWDGVTYQAPDPSGPAAHFVEARGPAMLLPAGDRQSGGEGKRGAGRVGSGGGRTLHKKNTYPANDRQHS